MQKTAVTDLTLSFDGKLLATCDTTTAWVWEMGSGALVARMIQREPNIGSSLRDQLKSVDFSPDGKLLATANGDHTARIWDASSGREVMRIQRDGMLERAFFSPDGKLLVTQDVAAGPAVCFWEAPDWHLAFHVEGGNVLLSPDGRLFAISAGGTVRVLEMASRREITSIAMPNPVWTKPARA